MRAFISTSSLTRACTRRSRRAGARGRRTEKSPSRAAVSAREDRLERRLVAAVAVAASSSWGARAPRPLDRLPPPCWHRRSCSRRTSSYAWPFSSSCWGRGGRLLTAARATRKMSITRCSASNRDPPERATPSRDRVLGQRRVAEHEPGRRRGRAARVQRRQAGDRRRRARAAAATTARLVGRPARQQDDGVQPGRDAGHRRAGQLARERVEQRVAALGGRPARMRRRWRSSSPRASSSASASWSSAGRAEVGTPLSARATGRASASARRGEPAEPQRRARASCSPTPA